MSITEYIGPFLLKLFGSSSQRYVKKQQELIDQINLLEEQYGQFTDAQLRSQTKTFRQQIRQLEEEKIGARLRERLKDIQLLPEEARKPAKQEVTDQLQNCCQDFLAEAFATVREVSDRHLGIRNVFDPAYAFDPSILSKESRNLYDQVKEQIAQGQDIHKIELTPAFYAEIRNHYDAAERPPFRFRHFNVQLIGGSVLYEGKIAEMATGEGKTLAATLAVYLVALSGRKVHVITVNDYLAQRDRDWMGPVYEALDLTVGAIQADMDTAGTDRKDQYDCDITYGTNNEFGFDYLRDNMKVALEHQVQGPLDYCIIDEVDSILIDEARTPLIISGPAEDDVSRYKTADQIARELMNRQKPYRDLEKQMNQLLRDRADLQAQLAETKKKKQDSSHLEKKQEQLDEKEGQLESKKTHATQYYEVEYDRHSVHLTHDGIGAAQELAGVGSFYVGANMDWPHLMEQALRAHVVFEREKDYVVQNGEVIIVDEFTGRLMHGRQWSDGLHQAVEAKENVAIKRESQTLATITIQNFFRLYQQLAGMTGTAMTEADEFANIYQLDVVSVPTNKPIVREDRDDLIYKTIQEKGLAILDDIYEVSSSGRPVLIGTISIEKNEAFSAALTKRHNLDHEVLNAKQHAREATIITKAGQQHQRRDGKMFGNVTIATNMAGRGTDIKLAQNVARMGGLHVLGTERHEARRIDNQLRGRCGRQGDPGSSQFFLSFEDELMQLFGGDRMLRIMSLFRWPEGEPLVHKKLSGFVEKTQKKVEERNFEARKSLLEYDEVMDYQRQVFYTRRQSILEGRDLEETIHEMMEDIIAETCQKMLSRSYPYECVLEWVRKELGLDIEMDRIQGSDLEHLEQVLRDHSRNHMEQEIGITLGEYMFDDGDPQEWDLKGLSQWAMSRFKVNVSQNQLRKMTPDEVQELLIQAAREQLDKQNYSRIAMFLDEGYPRRTLLDWFEQKCMIRIPESEIENKGPAEVETLLQEKARRAYAKREVEYPVDFILNVSLRRQQSGSSYAAQEVSQWAKQKYAAEIPVEKVQTTSFDQLRKELIELSGAYQNGRLREEIQTKLTQVNWDEKGREELAQWAQERFQYPVKPEQLNPEEAQRLLERQGRKFLRKELTELERYVLLQIYDSRWKDHLYAMDHLKGGIGLRGFAERDPKMEYKREGFRMFQEMLSQIRDKVTDIIFKAQLESRAQMRNVWNISTTMHNEFTQFQAQQQAAQTAGPGMAKTRTIKLEKPKVGRNDPCPCGSGKKFKKCCMNKYEEG